MQQVVLLTFEPHDPVGDDVLGCLVFFDADLAQAGHAR